jgi:hypothetical protein
MRRVFNLDRMIAVAPPDAVDAVRRAESAAADVDHRRGPRRRRGVRFTAR